MKKSFVLLAAALLTVGSFGCASNPRRNEPPRQTSAADGYEDNGFELNRNAQAHKAAVIEKNTDGGTVSGAPSSLGAASSGRGH